MFSLSFVPLPPFPLSPSPVSSLSRRGSVEFVRICEWFAARCDCILFMLDGGRLELMQSLAGQVLEKLRPQREKLRILLNKVDLLPPSDLLQASARLHWSLSKVLGGSNPPRAYMTSFGASTCGYVKSCKRSAMIAPAARNRPPPTPLSREHSSSSRYSPPPSSSSPAASSRWNEDVAVTEQADLIEDLRGLARESAVQRASSVVGRAQRLLVGSKGRFPLPTHDSTIFESKDRKRAAAVVSLCQRERICCRCHRHRITECYRRSGVFPVDAIPCFTPGFWQSCGTQAHLLILKHISERQGLFYRRSALKRMLKDLPDLFRKAEESSGLTCCEFPNMYHWRRGAESKRFWEIPRVKRRHIDEVLGFLSETIAPLLDTMTFSSCSPSSNAAVDISAPGKSPIQPSSAPSLSFSSSPPAHHSMVPQSRPTLGPNPCRSSNPSISALEVASSLITCHNAA
mmetsp:Transcript_24958/g.34832  ORF Transcript_24958/g.34832 Transcript_24958/m.34832 type:complete len:457 (-) Transcript_24958:38-1408(-)